jgi:hypothetical protein
LEFDDELVATPQRSELEFLDPTQSKHQLVWSKGLSTECTIARIPNENSYFRVMKIRNKLYFHAEYSDGLNIGKFTSREYIRLVLAIRCHYANPIGVSVTKLDDVYSALTLGYYLPNREYYLMLLISWPMGTAFCRNKFLVKNVMLQQVLIVLQDIGFALKYTSE